MKNGYVVLLHPEGGLQLQSSLVSLSASVISLTNAMSGKQYVNSGSIFLLGLNVSQVVVVRAIAALAKLVEVGLKYGVELVDVLCEGFRGCSLVVAANPLGKETPLLGQHRLQMPIVVLHQIHRERHAVLRHDTSGVTHSAAGYKAGTMTTP